MISRSNIPLDLPRIFARRAAPHSCPERPETLAERTRITHALGTIAGALVYDHNILVRILKDVIGFDWHNGNSRKNEPHGVSMAEAEQIFFSTPLLLLDDAGHSHSEQRFHALGRTIDGRKLHISFTPRECGKLIRVISARDMHRKERAFYEQATKDNS